MGEARLGLVEIAEGRRRAPPRGSSGRRRLCGTMGRSNSSSPHSATGGSESAGHPRTLRSPSTGGLVSPFPSTRLGRFAACHFLQYHEGIVMQLVPDHHGVWTSLGSL